MRMTSDLACGWGWRLIELEHDSVLNLKDIAVITITISTKDACPPLPPLNDGGGNTFLPTCHS